MNYLDHLDKLIQETRSLGLLGNVRSNKEDKIDAERTVSKRKVNDDYDRRIQQGRNELCNCGSGKKFKVCHGRVINEELKED